MFFVVVGVILVLMNLAGVGPVADWTWTLTGDLWKFATPFALAVGWWAWSDTSGLTKRRQMERMEQRKEERRLKNVEALGLNTRTGRKAGKR
jgi:small Trp-rich protein